VIVTAIAGEETAVALYITRTAGSLTQSVKALAVKRVDHPGDLVCVLL